MEGLEDWIRVLVNVMLVALLLSIIYWIAPKLYQLEFQRFKTSADIPAAHIKAQLLMKGYVMSVNDGDGMRVYHKPSFSSRSRPKMPKHYLRDETIVIRLAGIDAPEIGHSGKAGQPFAVEAQQYLAKMVQDRMVTVKLHALDQYSRLVASVYVADGWLSQKNVSLEMVKAGLAVVYKGIGAEYNGIESKLLQAESKAKERQIGVWSQKSDAFQSPGEYKKQLREQVHETNPASSCSAQASSTTCRIS